MYNPDNCLVPVQFASDLAGLLFPTLLVDIQRPAACTLINPYYFTTCLGKGLRNW